MQMQCCELRVLTRNTGAKPGRSANPMFRGTSTSPLVLFSSTSSNPFALFSRHVDPSLPEDSGLILLRDHDSHSADAEANDAGGLFRGPRFRLRPGLLDRDTAEGGSGGGHGRGDERSGHLLRSVVLHLQSPTLRTTFIRIPPLAPSPSEFISGSGGHSRRTAGPELELGITLPYLHLQVRMLGEHRAFCFEVGIRDLRGQRGRIRVSTFQKRPVLYPGRSSEDSARLDSARDEEEEDEGELAEVRARGAAHAEARRLWRDSPLLHLPLSTPKVPEKDPLVLTPWNEISLPLAHLVPYFHNGAYLVRRDATSSDGGPITNTHGDTPSIRTHFDRFESLAYVQIHANCRLRRIWCTAGMEKGEEVELRLFGYE